VRGAEALWRYPAELNLSRSVARYA